MKTLQSIYAINNLSPLPLRYFGFSTMNYENIVNRFVLPNLFYELIFMNEHGINPHSANFSSTEFVDDVIKRLVVTRYASLRKETQVVLRNTLRYFLATNTNDWDGWEIIWDDCSAPFELSQGVRWFIYRSYNILFPNDIQPNEDELQRLRVNNDFIAANLLI